MKRVLIIGFGLLIFLLIILGVTFLESLKGGSIPPPSQPASPTVFPSEGGAKVKYNKDSSDRLLEIVESRPTPVELDDSTLREQLIEELGNNSGITVETQSFKLEYVRAPDSFEAEIKTTEVNRAKNEAIDYLKTRGFSEDGICKLPLVFYLNFEVAKNLSDPGIEFSPMPDFCL